MTGTETGLEQKQRHMMETQNKTDKGAAFVNAPVKLTAGLFKPYNHMPRLSCYRIH